MAKKFFEATQMSAASLELAAMMGEILTDYAEQGFDLSLRQLYYQLVTRNAVVNTEQSYKNVGAVLGKARMNGYIDWESIVDRGRVTLSNSHWDSPSEIVRSCAAQFRYDTWQDQPWHVEVMVEKQALEGVLHPVCERLDIAFTANKGYSSLSALHEAGGRMMDALDAGKSVAVLYLGDHDPSGIDMTRDVRERLQLFASFRFNEPDDSRDGDWIAEARATRNPRRFKMYRNMDYHGQEFVVDRLALNMDQVEEKNCCRTLLK